MKLPNGWSTTKLREIGQCITGLTYSPNDVVDEHNGMLVLRSSNVQNGRLAFNDNVFVRAVVQVDTLTREGDILVCVRNGSRGLIGKSALIRGEGVGVAHGAFMMLFRTSDSDFVYQLFQSREYYRQVHENLGATINSINSSDFYKFKFLLPPKNERSEIADLLVTWDEAIEKTERLIAAKERSIRGVMQKLLMGRSFPEHRLSEFVHRVTRKNTAGNGLPLTISGRDGLISQSDFFEKRIAAEVTEHYSLLKQGEFSYNRSYSAGYPYGAIKRLDAYDEGIVSSLYLCFALNPDAALHTDYLIHFCEVGGFDHQIHMVAQEGARNHGLLNITAHDFFGMKLPLPPIEEQLRVVAILGGAGRELALLRKSLDQLRKQKRGLMQKLLTGQWRVKIKDQEVA